MTLHEAARVYRARGLSIIPVGRDKKPLVRWDEYQVAPAEPDQVDEWWSRWRDANIGVATGAVSGLVVLDADGPRGVASLDALGITRDTWISRTGRAEGGLHVFFRHPGVTIGNRAGVRPGLDVRGDGGYVIIPPSVHASGRAYEWLNAPDVAKLAEFPPALLELLAAPPAFAPTNGAAEIHEGERNDALYRLGRSLAAKGLTAAAIRAALLEENRERCRPPMPEREVAQIARHVATQPDRTTFHHPNGHSSATPVLVRLADVTAEPVEWLWLNRIPRGKLTLIIGEPGEGKSHLTLELGARTTRGASWPDGGTAPRGAVIILTSEDGIADTVRPRIDRLGGDPAMIYVLRAVQRDGQQHQFNLEDELAALEQALATTGAVLVIIDPLSAYLGHKDSYKDSEIRGVLSPLADLAERCRVALVGILHLTKAAQRRLLLRAQGSIAFVGQARSVLTVGKDQDVPGRRLLLSLKNNLGPEPAGLAFRISDEGLTWESGVVTGTAEGLLAVDEPGTRSERKERDDAVTFLRHLLREGAVASNQVQADAKANGIAQRTLWRAKTELGVLAERATTQSGKAVWYWALPPESGA